MDIDLEPATPNLLNETASCVTAHFRHDLEGRSDAEGIIDVHERAAEVTTRRPLDIVCHHDTGGRTVWPEPHEWHSTNTALLEQKNEHLLHQRIDGRVDRPARKRDPFPSAETESLQVPSECDRQEWADEVVQGLNG